MGLDEVLGFIEACTLDEAKAIRRESHKRYVKLVPKKTKAVVSVPDWAMDLAKAIAASVKESFPYVKEPDLLVWASDIDKIERIDKYPIELIQACVAWAINDDKFWKNQIRSGAALRRHIEKLYVAGKSSIDRKRGKVHVV